MRERKRNIYVSLACLGCLAFVVLFQNCGNPFEGSALDQSALEPGEGHVGAPTREQGPAQLRLQWDASDDPNVKGYRLYYGSNPGEYEASVDVGENLTYQVSGLEPGRYYFSVTGYDSSMRIESDFSNELEAVITR